MTPWHIGYAEADITPGHGPTLMAGYGRERYASGVISRLRAQAIALRDRRGHRAVLLAADVLDFDRVAIETIRRQINAANKLPAENIMVAASHTHWGPAINYRVNFAAGGVDIWYRKRLEETLVRLAGEALKDLAPGTVEYTSLQTRIGHNRRLPDKKGRITWGPYPEGSYDEHTPVLRFTRPRKTALAHQPTTIILVAHACHPTSSGTVAKWSADWPGAMRTRIEGTLGAGTRAVFAMGCGADAKVCHTDPKTGKPTFSASPAQSHAAGRRLATTVLTHLKKGELRALTGPLICRLASGELRFAPPFPHSRIETMAYDAKTHFGDAGWARQILAYPDRRKSLPYEVQVWRFGNALTLLALEGEVCSPLGPLARSLARTPAAMTIGYVNATEAYIPSKQIVHEGGYEGDTSHRAYMLPAPFTPKVEAEFRAIMQRAVR